ncbi:family 78 glycoside hydrolase catalytic domain [Cohnella sp. GCM10012308]|uniref:family 78 glycoside hydrolase catalytic domain n=1 Tax=Cohnella sp. GCM10012308 TaxID=3317329 RepID=UPI00360FA109
MATTRFKRRRPSELEWGADTGIVWHPSETETHYEHPVQSFCQFRKSFELPADAAAEGKLRIFADSKYIVYVNGVYAGRGPCRSDPRWQYVDEVDVGGLLRPGDNSIAVMVLYYGYGTGQSIDRIPALLAELRTAAQGGEALIVGTDETWLCRKAAAYDERAPRVNGCQGPIEIYDARLETEDWYKQEAVAEGWTAAKKRDFKLSPFWNLLKRPIPLLEETELDACRLAGRGVASKLAAPSGRLHLDMIEETKGIRLFAADSSDSPLDVWSKPAAAGEAEVLTYDFGRIEPGYLQIDVTGTSGTIIDVAYAEELWEGKALLNASNNRSLDRFILAEGRQRLEIAFGWKACRYVQLRIRHADSRPVCLHRIGLRTRGYPVTEPAVFKCSDPMLQRVWDISAHTLRICMQDAFVDSPSREQQQWMGDGRWQALYQTYYAGDGRLHRKLLEQVGQSQDWQGMTAQRYPDGHHNYPPIPSFCLHWVSSFGEYLEAYGDDGLLAEWWPNIVQALRWFSGFENKEGLLEDVPYWSYIDAGEAPLGRWPDVERGGIVTALNLLYLEAVRCAAGYARLVGDTEAEAYYARTGDRLADAVKRSLWMQEAGAYADCRVEDVLGPLFSESANALALAVLHEAGDARSEAIYRSVFSSVAQGSAIQASPFFMQVVYRALGKLGREDRMLDLVRERYGPMVEAGATTVWEWWELFYPDARTGETQYSSACHAWGSMPVYMFLRSIAGVRSLEPGRRVVEIAPWLPDGLDWAEGEIPTACGRLTVRAERESGGRTGAMLLHLTVPEGLGVLAKGESLGAGEHHLRIG